MESHREGRPQPEAERERYDLSKPEADYPAWKGRPLRTYLLCTHARSGSTLLGEAIYFSGSMGCPLEYFHAGFQPSLAEVWGTHDDESYLKAVIRHRTDQTGSLGVKLFWMDLISLSQKKYPGAANLLRLDLLESPDLLARAYEFVQSVVSELFPNPVFIFLTRKDRLRQAISSLTSAQARVWRKIPGIEERIPVQTPSYDYEEILDRIGYAAYCEAMWEGFFHFADVNPCRITYEDLAVDYHETIEKFLKSMGKWKPGIQIKSPRLKRQADRISEEFALRFLAEHQERTRIT